MGLEARQQDVAVCRIPDGHGKFVALVSIALAAKRVRGRAMSW